MSHNTVDGPVSLSEGVALNNFQHLVVRPQFVVCVFAYLQFPFYDVVVASFWREIGLFSRICMSDDLNSSLYVIIEWLRHEGLSNEVVWV